MNKSTIRLCSLRATDGGARLAMHVEIKSDAGVETEVLSPYVARLEELPQIGGMSAEELDFYREESQFAEALAKGYRCLGYANVSPAALLQKLQKANVSATRAKEVLAYLTETGMFCEEENVLHETEKCLAKLWGDRRILMALQGKGYGSEAVSVAYHRLCEEDDDARCARLIQKRRLSVEENEQDRGRLLATLFRYGYHSTNIKNAIRIVKEDNKRR